MRSAWRSQDSSQQHSRKERLPCDLETGSPHPNNWQRDFHKSPPIPSPLQYLHKETGGSEQQWFNPDAYACERRAYLQNSQWHPHSSHRCPEAAGKVSHWCQETESEVNPSKTRALWCSLDHKAVGQAMPAVSFNGGVKERANSLRHLGIHFDWMLTYKTQV